MREKSILKSYSTSKLKKLKLPEDKLEQAQAYIREEIQAVAGRILGKLHEFSKYVNARKKLDEWKKPGKVTYTPIGKGS